MNELRQRLMGRGSRHHPLAIAKELSRIYRALIWRGLFGLPYEVARSFVLDPALNGPLADARLFDLFGRVALAFFDDLGPIYGKAGQIALSRLSPAMQEVAETLRLTRLYKDWPPLPFTDVAAILDREVPAWRSELKVTAYPLGVASLAQVHAAEDRQGRAWVIKVIKPHAARRLLETVEAIEQLVATLKPLAITLVAQRLLREALDLCLGFRRELDLGRERETIEKVAEKLKSRRQRVLVIPQVNPSFCTRNVLTVERFTGISLSAVVSGKVDIEPAMRQRLAKSMLGELLVQVFELGLFHADPHAGNLILLDQQSAQTLGGAVGLFDWGLAGELSDADRRHIAAILRSVLALDLEQLIEALRALGRDSGRELTDEEIRKELKSVINLIKRGREEGAARPSLQSLFEACLKAADRLGIAVPEGLLLMVKSLITIEGLAKGIDPTVSVARVAGPVLFKAARPGIKELMAMGRRLPQMARLLFSN